MKKQKNDSRLEERVTALEETVKKLASGINSQADLWYATRNAYNFIASHFPKENTQEQPSQGEQSNEDNKKAV